jgi:hypothetical protein
MKPWIDKAHEVLKGGEVIRGQMYHFMHEHPFDYSKVIGYYMGNTWKYPDYFERGEDFSLKIINKDRKKFFLDAFP